MSFTIDQTFDLLFRSGENEDGTAYESRRWFRRPPVGGVAMAALPEAADADRLLGSQVAASSNKWAREFGVTRPAKLDLARHVPPRMPYDVFAFAAHLVEQAGIYHHLQPLKKPPTVMASPSPATGTLRHIDITREDRTTVTKAATAWADLSPPDDMVDLAQLLNRTVTWELLAPLFESWWVVMGACGGEPVLATQVTGSAAVPAWWKHAWRLLAISDEAAQGTAYQFDIAQIAKFVKREPADIRWFEGEVMLDHAGRSLQARKAADPTGLAREFADITSLSVANPAMVNVLPKVRTASVGCTLRSLSHHLALLPAAGVVKGRWTPNYKRPGPTGGGMPGGVMNLVLVPMPYSLGARSFSQALVEDVSGGAATDVPRFGYFDVKQDWIEGPDRRMAIRSLRR